MSSAASARKKKRSPDESKERTLSVDLSHARWRHFTWTLVAAAGAALFIFAIGGAGILLLGVPCVLLALSSGRSFVKTLLHPPGRIAIGQDRVDMTQRLCSGREVSLPLSELRHAYLLRHTAPWSTTGPVLVVETEERVFQYPRDWFATDLDQWRVFTVLNRRIRQP